MILVGGVFVDVWRRCGASELFCHKQQRKVEKRKTTDIFIVLKLRSINMDKLKSVVFLLKYLNDSTYYSPMIGNFFFQNLLLPAEL